MKRVQLRKMTQPEFENWFPDMCRDYANDKVRAGNWQACGAKERSLEECRKLLPLGVETPHHHLLIASCADTLETIGILWLFTDTESPGKAFVYNIEVEAERRGLGYGKALMKAGETFLKAKGIKTLSLHVFGFNKMAQSLYQSLGFQTTNITMEKHLSDR